MDNNLNLSLTIPLIVRYLPRGRDLVSLHRTCKEVRYALKNEVRRFEDDTSIIPFTSLLNSFGEIDSLKALWFSKLDGYFPWVTSLELTMPVGKRPFEHSRGTTIHSIIHLFFPRLRTLKLNRTVSRNHYFPFVTTYFSGSTSPNLHHSNECINRIFPQVTSLTLRYSGHLAPINKDFMECLDLENHPCEQVGYDIHYLRITLDECRFLRLKSIANAKVDVKEVDTLVVLWSRIEVHCDRVRRLVMCVGNMFTPKIKEPINTVSLYSNYERMASVEYPMGVKNLVSHYPFRSLSVKNTPGLTRIVLTHVPWGPWDVKADVPCTLIVAWEGKNKDLLYATNISRIVFIHPTEAMDSWRVDRDTTFLFAEDPGHATDPDVIWYREHYKSPDPSWV